MNTNLTKEEKLQQEIAQNKLEVQQEINANKISIDRRVFTKSKADKKELKYLKSKSNNDSKSRFVETIISGAKRNRRSNHVIIIN